MADQQKLASLWVWLLLMATLCPGAQHVYSKHGGSIRGRGKGDGSKVSLPQSKGLLPKPGLKWAGAAAAGMLGGTGTGYGLGFLGKPKHSSGNRHGHRSTADGGQQQGQGYHNRSLWRAFGNAAAPAPTTNFLCLTFVVSSLAVWARGD
ncbi:hypothetical protein JOB18_004393 [Solea senegalensis]|uniref:Shadow of prion protein 2 n=1 Tax=Solea senegalensis TaxID=28829 RepID=A0AAV6QEZ8_SOLSE|nr:hypothetical protein JOB18_004393 [Solea senegalensis]